MRIAGLTLPSWGKKRRTLGAPADENPGQTSLYPSKEETQAYARKVDRLAADVLAWYEQRLEDPTTFGTALRWNKATHFTEHPGYIGETWLTKWSRKSAEIQSGWWGAADEYDTVSAFHGELREFCERAKEMGLPNVPIVGRESRYTDTLPGAAASKISTGVVIALVVGAAIIAWRATPSSRASK